VRLCCPNRARTRRQSPKEVIQHAGLPTANPTYSQAIQANGFIYVSGQIGIDLHSGRLISGGIVEEARQALENTAAILQAAGSGLEKVVLANLYLTEFAKLAEVNRVYALYFPQEGPAKMACGVSDLYGGARFEIQVVAHK
jgi:2-iminobutanoate/2-iminopropanoate deaminase